MRPRLLLYCFLLAALSLNAQQGGTPLVHITHLSDQGISLNTGWKLQAGDNPGWKDTGVDDSRWTMVDISQPARRLQPLTHGDIVWLRQHFAVPPSPADSLLALRISQFGASEIYVDGRLVTRLGRIRSAADFTAFNPHDRPIPIHLPKAASHLLAIRLAPDIPSSRWALQRSQAAPLSVRLQPLATALSEQEQALKQFQVRMGAGFVYGTFGLLFLLLFLFYPRQRLHLFFALFNLFAVLNILNEHFYLQGQYSLTERVYLYNAQEFISRVLGLSLLMFMLHALNRMKPFYWWFAALVLLVDFPLAMVLPASYHFISDAIHLFFVFLCSWLGVKAFRSKNREDLLIGLVALAVVLINAGFFLYQFTGINMIALVGTINFILISVGILIYLALRYAHANTALEQQLVQVKTLSEENLRREQEKQQILSSQKETLERQVEERTAQLNRQKQALEATLADLKAAQQQLIQSEKMASLGELTAGIAHEIQNPLNFINNFSEVTTELLDEMNEALGRDDKESALQLSKDIKDNLEKVSNHGQRADAIVKSMLQHSRKSSGQKEPIDINALADEYLRLSYHGLRAKDKSFNANIKTEFDNTLGKVAVIPQDMGRVLLNLFNNAFYAVHQKKTTAGDGYEPTVWVSTQQKNGCLEVHVRDNGPGIPGPLKQKIFQPFFTTKPAGEGTGLGLSLSYDIITKGHAGSMKAETREGEFTEFIVSLPTQTNNV